MGCVSSCFLVDGDDERENANDQRFRYCVCLRCLTQQLYAVIRQRGEPHVTTLSLHGVSPTVSSASEDISIPNSFRSPPTPLPYDDPRCSPSNRQREGLVPRRDKASRHSYEEYGPLRRNVDPDKESTDTDDMHNDSVYGLCISESSVKHPALEVACGEAYKYYSSEEEDVCPTCLEEYTTENPRIALKCSHNYHLGCIYEWMERSEACPVCGKVMLFSEAI